MPRYFLQLAYQGTAYSGFQSQHNANTIQQEVEKALFIIYKTVIVLTGSSRTDAGVHALQNYFHFDINTLFASDRGISSSAHFLYKLNAILPPDIVITNIWQVAPEAHCRFDAMARAYKYYIYQTKDPFARHRAYYYPYTLQIEAMQQAAELIIPYSDFTSFSKKHTQVKNFNCIIQQSEWVQEQHYLVYMVKANRFLRGMVKALTATMLQIGRGKLSINDFKQIIESKDCRQADFSAPGHGLFLTNVEFSENFSFFRP